MNKLNYYLSALLAIAVLGFSSCSKDDDPTVQIEEGIPVADGYYIAKSGEDPVFSSQLKSSTVDAPSFSSMEREGFIQGYMYLTAGTYNMVQVTSKEIVATYGGTQSTVSGDDVRNPECDETTSNYNLVDVALDGSAFTVANDGLYVVAYDETLSELVFDEIETAGIIGAATPGGWGADTELNTSSSITADGASWTLEGVTIDVGEMKFRFNCRWAIDRRLDINSDFDNANGYSFFTNFGNALNDLQPGNDGPNIQNDEYAVFTVSLNWDPADGFSAEMTKTGEAEPKPEYPAELYMVGATIGGWDWAANGIQMIPVHSNPHLFWAIVWMDADAADAGIKFAPQKDWIGDFGVEGSATDGVYAKGTSNVPAPASTGYYMVVVNLETGAETIEVNEPLVYGIGDAFGSWDAMNAANLFTVDNVNMVIESPAFTADGNLRIYADATTLQPVDGDPAVEWWQREFVVIGGNIEYRATGGDQTAVPVTTGQTVSLDFINGTGTIN